MTDSKCSIDGCERRTRARGWCTTHYERWRKHGDPLAPAVCRRANGLSLEEAFQHWMPGDPPHPGTVWTWTGSVNSKGYGLLGFGGRMVYAHRVAYEVFRGPIPEGLVIRHINDTPIDVNPWNMELGTPAENSRDMVIRGRTTSTLTDDDVLEIRRIYASEELTLKALGLRYGITEQGAWRIVHRKSWEHI